jgi:hypothetical protein
MSAWFRCAQCCRCCLPSIGRCSRGDFMISCSRRRVRASVGSLNSASSNPCSRNRPSRLSGCRQLSAGSTKSVASRNDRQPRTAHCSSSGTDRGDAPAGPRGGCCPTAERRWAAFPGHARALTYGTTSCLDSVRACAAAIGRTPTSQDYMNWARARRRNARERGRSPEVPSFNVVLRILAPDRKSRDGWRLVKDRVFGPEQNRTERR